MKLEQLENKNQFVIYNNDYAIFQSYSSTIAIYKKSTNTLYLNYAKWDYSRTTLKHLYIYITRFTSRSHDAMLYYYKNNKRKSIQHFTDTCKKYNDKKYSICNAFIELTEDEIINYRNSI